MKLQSENSSANAICIQTLPFLTTAPDPMDWQGTYWGQDSSALSPLHSFLPCTVSVTRFVSSHAQLGIPARLAACQSVSVRRSLGTQLVNTRSVLGDGVLQVRTPLLRWQKNCNMEQTRLVTDLVRPERSTIDRSIERREKQEKGKRRRRRRHCPRR